MSARTVAAGDPLAEQAVRRPASVAIDAGSRRWTYGELDRAVTELAGTLREAVPGPGVPVGVLLPSGPLAAIATHAARRAGLALAPGHRRWTAMERARFLERLAPGALFLPGDAGPPGAARDAWIAVPLPHDLAGSGTLWARRDAAGRPVPEGVLLWTSGTQGSPRVASLPWSALHSSAEAAASRLSLGPEDAWLASLAPAHVGGLAIPLRTTVAGARLVAGPPGFDPEAVRARLEEAAVTHVSLVPTMLRALLEHRGDPPSALRCALVGGAATPGPLLERALAAGWPVALTYGLTEAGSQVATAAPDLVRRRPGTVGPPLDGVSVRIRGAAEGGDAEPGAGAATGAVGRIAVKGPTVMRGYASADGTLDGLAPGGWLETGDLGRLDEEGNLWVTGRASARIVTGGANVDPAEVEAVLASHPLVREVAVLGVPDPVWGERVVAVVVAAPEPGRVAEPGPSAEAREALERWTRARLSGPRRPRGWLFVDVLPRTRTGKTDRSALARRLAEEEPRPGPAPAERGSEAEPAPEGGADE